MNPSDRQKYINLSYNKAIVNFSLYYLSLYEASNLNPEDAVTNFLLSRLKEEMDKFFNGDNMSTENLEAIRNTNIASMVSYTNAVDAYETLEYILNRVEHRFIGAKELPEDYSDLKYTEKIMAFLADSGKENRNFNAHRIISELPVRVAKERFFENIRDRLSVYAGGDESVFLDKMDQIRSVAGITDLEDKDTPVKLLENLKDLLFATDPKTMTEDEFYKYRETLTTVNVAFNDRNDVATLLQDTLNALLLFDYSSPYVTEVPAYNATCLKIVENVFRMFVPNEQNNADLLSKTYELCTELEGIPEELSEQLYRLSGRLDIKSDDLLRKLMILSSSSSFASLENVDGEAENQLTKEEFETVSGIFLEELAQFLKDKSRTVSRGIMGRIYSILPPLFTTAEELETYIANSLSGCTDTAEKLGVIDILEEIMRVS